MIVFYVELSSYEYRFKQPEMKLNNTFNTKTRTTASSLEIRAICSESITIVNKVYAEKSDSKNSEQTYWSQDVPSIFLDCNQLARSLQITPTSKNSTENDEYEITPTISLLRLARKMRKLDVSHESREPFKIVVIGGSMTTGIVDVGKRKDPKIAWPYKLANFMSEKWPQKQIEIINLAKGGANEETWLGNLDVIVDQSPIDVILVESAVNDQCDYNNQVKKAAEVNRTSRLLLNILSQSFADAAVFSVELFRTAYNNASAAHLHCKNHVGQMFDPSLNQTCYWCPQ